VVETARRGGDGSRLLQGLAAASNLRWRGIAWLDWAWIFWLNSQPPEPSPCLDCGRDTTPCKGGLRCRGRRPWCRHKGRWEWYSVQQHLWEEALGSDHDRRDTFLCIGCLERRLGRQLTPDDFTEVAINELTTWDTPRLADRKLG
jgi:hypothetical protein